VHGRRFTLPDGTVAYVDYSSPPYEKCSAAGCRRKGSLQCDFPIDAAPPSHAPRVGDARVHKKHHRVFYVRLVHGNATVTITESPPGSRELRFPKTVTVEDWNEKTAPMCSKSLCPKCAAKLGSLDICKDHTTDEQPQQA
jgi:hypothetical protein